MSHSLPLFLKNEKLAQSQYSTLDVMLSITGAKTNADNNYPYKFPALFGYDSTDLTQTLVEAFLGHTSQIVCATAFGSTAMGTDALGFVIDMGAAISVQTGLSSGGQASQVSGIYVQAALTSTASAAVAPVTAWVPGSRSALPNTLASAIAVSPEGDLYGHVVITGLDAATAGFVQIKVLYTAI
jgi:hypothetical protein